MTIDEYREKIIKYLLVVSKMYSENDREEFEIVSHVLSVCVEDVKNDNIDVEE